MAAASSADSCAPPMGAGCDQRRGGEPSSRRATIIRARNHHQTSAAIEPAPSSNRRHQRTGADIDDTPATNLSMTDAGR
jgi:hypothetical protein